MDGVVYLSHHSKNELSLNKPLKTPWHLMNHGICFRTAGADACFMPVCGAFCLRNDEEVMGMLILGAVLVLLAAGCLSVRLRLAAARENVRSAMGRTCLRMYRRWSKMCVCCPRRWFRCLSLHCNARMKPIRELADGAACCLRMLRIGYLT